jgi:hypothetical protein
MTAPVGLRPLPSSMLPVLASQALSFALSHAVRSRVRGRSFLNKDDNFPMSRRLAPNSRFGRWLAVSYAAPTPGGRGAASSPRPVSPQPVRSQLDDKGDRMAFVLKLVLEDGAPADRRGSTKPYRTGGRATRPRGSRPNAPPHRDPAGAKQRRRAEARGRTA